MLQAYSSRPASEAVPTVFACRPRKGNAPGRRAGPLVEEECSTSRRRDRPGACLVEMRVLDRVAPMIGRAGFDPGIPEECVSGSASAHPGKASVAGDPEVRSIV